MSVISVQSGFRRCVLALLSTTPVWYLRADAIVAFAAVGLVASWPWTGEIEMPKASLGMAAAPTPGGAWAATRPTSTSWLALNLEVTETHGSGWVRRTIREPIPPLGAEVYPNPNPPPPLAPPPKPYALWLSLIDSGQSGGLYSLGNGSPAGWERAIIADLAWLESEGRALPGTGGSKITRIDGMLAYTLMMGVRNMPLVLVLVAVLLWFLRAAQRADSKQRLVDITKGLCPNCGYTTDGLSVGATCPECGCDPGRALVEDRTALGMTGGKGSS